MLFSKVHKGETIKPKITGVDKSDSFLTTGFIKFLQVSLVEVINDYNTVMVVNSK